VNPANVGQSHFETGAAVIIRISYSSGIACKLSIVSGTVGVDPSLCE